MRVAPPAEIVMLTGPVAVSTGLLESVALTVRFTIPATVGVPLTRQLLPRERPAGKMPVRIVHE